MIWILFLYNYIIPYLVRFLYFISKWGALLIAMCFHNSLWIIRYVINSKFLSIHPKLYLLRFLILFLALFVKFFPLFLFFDHYRCVIDYYRIFAIILIFFHYFFYVIICLPWNKYHILRCLDTSRKDINSLFHIFMLALEIF